LPGSGLEIAHTEDTTARPPARRSTRSHSGSADDPPLPAALVCRVSVSLILARIE